MKRVGATLLFLLGVSSAWAQVPIPGTFTSQTSQPGVVVSGPILTPPLVSFGSGLTPPVVVNGQAAIVSAPESTSAQPSMIMDNQRPPMPGYVSTGRVLEMSAETNAAEAPAVQASAQRAAYFDFVVAPSSGSSSGVSAMATGVGDTDLGQVAASLRKGPAPTQRSFTNEDIARLNGITNNNYPMPGASTEQPAYPQQQQPHSETNAPLPPGAKPSPFFPRPMAQSENSASGQPSVQPAPTQLAQNTMQPAEQQPQAEQSNPAASNQQSEKTSPSSAQASTQRRLPASSSPLPLIAMLGAVALGTGYVIGKRS
jgi:hypothetical protein